MANANVRAATARRRRSASPVTAAGSCVFCGSAVFDGEGWPECGWVKRDGRDREWFHMACYDRWRASVRKGDGDA